MKLAQALTLGLALTACQEPQVTGKAEQTEDIAAQIEVQKMNARRAADAALLLRAEADGARDQWNTPRPESLLQAEPVLEGPLPKVRLDGALYDIIQNSKTGVVTLLLSQGWEQWPNTPQCLEADGDPRTQIIAGTPKGTRCVYTEPESF